MVDVVVALHPAVKYIKEWRGEFMSARAVSKYTQKLTGGVGAVFLRFLRPDDRRIMSFDPDDEWWRVEARRGHGPHGASRRRARSSAGRVRGRREVDVVVA